MWRNRKERSGSRTKPETPDSEHGTEIERNGDRKVWAIDQVVCFLNAFRSCPVLQATWERGANFANEVLFVQGLQV